MIRVIITLILLFFSPFFFTGKKNTHHFYIELTIPFLLEKKNNDLNQFHTLTNARPTIPKRFKNFISAFSWRFFLLIITLLTHESTFQMSNVTDGKDVGKEKEKEKENDKQLEFKMQDETRTVSSHGVRYTPDSKGCRVTFLIHGAIPKDCFWVFRIELIYPDNSVQSRTQEEGVFDFFHDYHQPKGKPICLSKPCKMYCKATLKQTDGANNFTKDIFDCRVSLS